MYKLGTAYLPRGTHLNKNKYKHKMSLLFAIKMVFINQVISWITGVQDFTDY